MLHTFFLPQVPPVLTQTVSVAVLGNEEEESFVARLQQELANHTGPEMCVSVHRQEFP